MVPRDIVTIRRLLTQASRADEVAQWFIELLIVPSPIDGMRDISLTFMPPAIPDSVFGLEVHRQRFAGFYSHAMMTEALVGRIEICPALRDGTFGESVFEVLIVDTRVVFPNSTGIDQYYADQGEYDQIRAETSALILGAIQGSLRKVSMPRPTSAG